MDLSPPDELQVLSPLPSSAHKGTAGRVLLVAGSWGMHGAAALAAAAAFRAGAGLVQVALPECIYPMVGALEPRATFLPLPMEDLLTFGEEAVERLQVAAEVADVVAMGPGMGGTMRTRQVVRSFVSEFEGRLVLDADGLNAFSGDSEAIARPRTATVVTPHPGELERLTGQHPGPDDDARRIAAVDLALRIGGTVLLKGERTVVTDGLSWHVNDVGTPALATAGSGDVLTGLLAALLCRVADASLAARCAAWAHGHAGRLAEAQWTERGTTARDLPDVLPHALALLQRPADRP